MKISPMGFQLQSGHDFRQTDRRPGQKQNVSQAYVGGRHNDHKMYNKPGSETEKQVSTNTYSYWPEITFNNLLLSVFNIHLIWQNLLLAKKAVQISTAYSFCLFVSGSCFLQITASTVMFLGFWTDRSGQTMEQSDQGLHCLQFPLHLLNALL